MKTRVYSAWVTPMSRTRVARCSNRRDSARGSPKSLMSNAPETLNRSVIVVFIWALSPYDSRVSPARRRPTHRAGNKKTGRIARETSVIFQDRTNIAARVTATPIVLPTTDDNVSVNACCAPSTSLFNRVTSAPVCVRVKNAIGMSWMWL